MTVMEPQNKSDSMMDKETGSALYTVSPHIFCLFKRVHTPYWTSRNMYGMIILILDTLLCFRIV